MDAFSKDTVKPWEGWDTGVTQVSGKQNPEDMGEGRGDVVSSPLALCTTKQSNPNPKTDFHVFFRLGAQPLGQ